jgi:hypothetical protein
MEMLRTRWAAIGAAVAVTLGAGGLSIVGATTSTGERSVYVPITPCRLADTRPAPDTRGPRTSPLGPDETFTLNAHGSNGDCTIPAGATALSLNVTAVGPTAATFLTLFPAGATKPLTSNLNPTPGQPPVPNAVTVDINGAGQFSVFNKNGSVDVIVDIAGYYEDHNHDDRYVQLPTDKLVVNPIALKPITGTGWTVTFLPAHAAGAVDCLAAPIEPPVGRTVISAHLSYGSSTGANPVRAGLIALRNTPGPVVGALTFPTTPDVNAPVTVGVIGSVTLVFPPGTTTVADTSYSIVICTDDAMSVTGLWVELG